MSFQKELLSLHNCYLSISEDKAFLGFISEKENHINLKKNILHANFDLYNIINLLTVFENSLKKSTTSPDTFDSTHYSQHPNHNQWLEIFYVYKLFYQEIIEEYTLYFINKIKF